MMKIVDFEKKGNMVRFYLANEINPNYHGDDWNDSPYQDNAGIVYNEYYDAVADIAFPFNAEVLEPAEDNRHIGWCKDSMKYREIPCIVVIPYAENSSWYYHNEFIRAALLDTSIKFYFGDEMEPTKEGEIRYVNLL